MCGISCIIDPSDKLNVKGLIDKMNMSANHRGPDGVGNGFYKGVGLGHTRLSIIDLNERASQPMSLKGHHLSFNGEIYNYVELRDELKNLGHSFATKSDTEVLLIALIEWGEAAYHKLNGMFAFFYLDEKNATLHMVRDRFGIKPLVYAKVDNSIIAASEPKQILSTGLITPTMNIDVALEFLEKSALNRTDETFFEGIREIRSGCTMKVNLRDNTLCHNKWYDLSQKISNSNDSYEEATQTVSELFRDSVDLRLRSDVPVGACLSGGIDSSAITSVSAKMLGEKRLSTITTFASHAGYDERVFSRVVNKKFGCNSFEVEPEIDDVWNLKNLQKVNYFQDQPIPSGSHFNESAVFQTAREQSIIVMLDGQGSDEYFGGYGEFWMSAQLSALKSGKIITFLKRIFERARVTKQSRVALLYRAFKHLFHTSQNTPLMIGPLPVAWLKVPRKSQEIQSKRFNEIALAEIQTTSLPYQLHSEDRNSMRWSIESRLPFLDYRLIEYVMSLPEDFRVGKIYQKRILRDAIPELPELVASRKDKIGFASPDFLALMNCSEDVRLQLISALQKFSGFLDEEIILKAFDEMIHRKTWYDPIFFRIISLMTWADVFNCVIPKAKEAV